MFENQNKNSGWTEKKDPFTFNKVGEPVAKRHHEVAQKKEFNKEFGSKEKISIKPRHLAMLHFDIKDDDVDKFTDLALVKFRKEHEYLGFIPITISRDEANRTVVELPKEFVILYHDYMLANSDNKFGADPKDLIEYIKENDEVKSWK